LTLSLYDASIPTFIRALRNLDAMMDKASGSRTSLAAIVESRLAPDMFPFTRQIQTASDAAKGAAARLAGIAPPSFPDEETTFAELKARLARTIAFLETVKPGQIDGREAATIELPVPGRTLTFTAKDFLFNFALPNFFFHVVTAYGLMRKEGVPLGKMDYLAGADALSDG
jgi:hypothetical protein